MNTQKIQTEQTEQTEQGIVPEDVWNYVFSLDFLTRSDVTSYDDFKTTFSVEENKKRLIQWITSSASKVNKNKLTNLISKIYIHNGAESDWTTKTVKPILVGYFVDMLLADVTGGEFKSMDPPTPKRSSPKRGKLNVQFSKPKKQILTNNSKYYLDDVKINNAVTFLEEYVNETDPSIDITSNYIYYLVNKLMVKLEKVKKENIKSDLLPQTQSEFELPSIKEMPKINQNRFSVVVKPEVLTEENIFSENIKPEVLTEQLKEGEKDFLSMIPPVEEDDEEDDEDLSSAFE